ncbi:hypothetical protein QR680_003228 [Steinernema hermaphroditum]|uniref:Nematode cuticle collagen N-terminal domain-containing protein n=1 Tax=Steinernema hermaphroditum TaxID=289476 RepID=A0AA39LJS9_9BILA|nr:hypothetical protein QR680_003228 [Steinernema hermaphroditum]
MTAEGISRISSIASVCAIVACLLYVPYMLHKMEAIRNRLTVKMDKFKIMEEEEFRVPERSVRLILNAIAPPLNAVRPALRVDLEHPAILDLRGCKEHPVHRARRE